MKEKPREGLNVERGLSKGDPISSSFSAIDLRYFAIDSLMPLVLAADKSFERSAVDRSLFWSGAFSASREV